MQKPLLILLVFFTSCHKPLKKNEDIKIIPVVDVIGKGEILNLSDYAKSIEYIPLQMNDSILLGDIEEVIYEDGHIVLYDLQTNMCKVFRSDGSFKKQLGRRGQGPNEYTGIRALSYMPKTKNIFLDVYPLNFYVYDLDGNLKEILPYVKVPEPYSSPTTVAIDENLYFSHLVSMSDFRYRALIWGQKDTTRIYKLVKNTVQRKQDEDVQSVSVTTMKWRFRNEMRSVWEETDTIYTVDRDMEVKSSFVLDLGQYRIPVGEVDNRTIASSKYIVPHYHRFCESSQYLFMQFNFYKLAPESFTHMVRNPRGGQKEVRESRVYGLFDKKNEKLVLLNQPVKHKYLGFKNDLDGGPCFWPKYVSQGDKMVTWWIASDFLEIYNQLENPSPELQQMAEKLSPDDNPVLMVVTLK